MSADMQQPGLQEWLGLQDEELLRRLRASPTLGISGPPDADPDQVQVGGDHYKRLKVQPWDAMEAWATPEQFRGYLLLTAVGYLARVSTPGAAGKGGRVDVAKARHVLDKLLSVWPED